MKQRSILGIVALTLAGSVSASALATPNDGLLDSCTQAPVSGAESELFKDLPAGAIGHDEAALLFNESITLGCSASPQLFCPNCEISRAQAVTMVVRATKLPLQNPAQPTFSDVAPGSTHYQTVETAVAAGITLGCGGGMFCPNDPLRREALAAFVARGAGLTLTTPATPSFSDVPTSNAFYAEVEALKASCVTDGCTAAEFCPTNEATRAQAAVFIARAFDLSNINPCLPADAGTDAGADADSDGGTDASSGGTGGSGVGGSAGWTDGGVVSTGGKGGGSKGTSTSGSDDSGCGCRTPTHTGSPHAAWLAGSLLAFGLWRRRAPRTLS